MLQLACATCWWSLKPDSLCVIVEKEFLALLQGGGRKWHNVYEKQCVSCKGSCSPGNILMKALGTGSLSLWVLVSDRPHRTSWAHPLTSLSLFSYIKSGSLPYINWDLSVCSVKVGVHPFLSPCSQALGIMGLMKSCYSNCPQGKKKGFWGTSLYLWIVLSAFALLLQCSVHMVNILGPAII